MRIGLQGFEGGEGPSVVPDPYYGYGHFPTLVCQQCESQYADLPKKLGNLWYERKGLYREEVDDYFLGLAKKKPIDWCWSNQHGVCHVCTTTIQIGEQRIVEDYIFVGKEMYYVGNHQICEKCAIKIWKEDPDFDGFRRKLYCCSRDPKVEAEKASQNRSPKN